MAGGGLDLIFWKIRSSAVIVAISALCSAVAAILSRCDGSGLFMTSKDGITPNTSREGSSPSGPMVSFIPFIASLKAMRGLSAA